MNVNVYVPLVNAMAVADNALYVFGNNTLDASEVGDVPPSVIIRIATETVAFSVNPVINAGEKVLEAETKDCPLIAYSIRVSVPPFKLVVYPINNDLGCIRMEVMVGLDAIDNIYYHIYYLSKGRISYSYGLYKSNEMEVPETFWFFVLGVITLNLSPAFKYIALGEYTYPYPELDAKPFTVVNMSLAFVLYHVLGAPAFNVL